MKKNKIPVHLLAALLIVTSVLLMPALTASAAPAKCGDVETSIDFGCTGDTTNSITNIILYVINFLAVGVGIAVVGGIAWGGWVYASANGDAGKAKEGRMIVINAVIGLVLFLVLWAAVNFLVPGGLFG